jgi:putative cardiolipin synthase
MFWRTFILLTVPVLVQAKTLPGPSSENPSIYAELKLPANDLEVKSGIYTLENGGKSLAARLWLMEHAQKSIDIQYYSFARNVTGLIACQYVVSAADRGVKVRILVDDVAGRMNSYELKVLDAHPNIEIRVYNAGIKIGRIDKRLKNTLSNRNRILRRMHNKVMYIDGQAAITGGRNISDEYFDYSGRYNFRDRDILVFGKATTQFHESFNEFWKDSLTVTAESLVGKGEKGFTLGALFGKMKKILNDTSEAAPHLRKHILDFPGEIATAKQEGKLLVLDNVTFISDVPGKNEQKPDRKGGRTTDTIVSLIKSAKHTIDIQSPYFITTDEMKKLLHETVARGVKVRVVTNSLASTDNHEAFSGYQRERQKNLCTGVEIYEFRPDPAVRFTISVPDVQSKLHYKAVYGLHSKAMIIDGEITLIGSYNLDPRSANLNTECIVVTRSKEAAKNLSVFVEEEYKPQNAWLITKDFNPDKEASFKKRVKAFTRRVIPKRML